MPLSKSKFIKQFAKNKNMPVVDVTMVANLLSVTEQFIDESSKKVAVTMEHHKKAASLYNPVLGFFQTVGMDSFTGVIEFSTKEDAIAYLQEITSNSKEHFVLDGRYVCINP